MLPYGGIDGYGLGNRGGSSSGSSTVYVVLSSTQWKNSKKIQKRFRAECVYTNQEMAYSHALERMIEDGSACLDDQGVERLGRLSRDLGAMSMPFRESWKRVHEFLEDEKKNLDWDVWPSCWVQETELNVRRESGGPNRMLEGLQYIFSDEVAQDESDEDVEEEEAEAALAKALQC